MNKPEPMTAQDWLDEEPAILRAEFQRDARRWGESNPAWLPIVDAKPKALWGSVAEIIAAYQDAEPVRVSRSQRYGLTLVEPLPGPRWSR